MSFCFRRCAAKKTHEAAYRMQLIARSYDMIELQRVRGELQSRGIRVHVSDEFTYAIPGMPGAEQPRGIWVPDEDVMPARRVVSDLLGPERLEPEQQASDGRDEHEDLASGRMDAPDKVARGNRPASQRPALDGKLGFLLTVITVLAIAVLTWG